MEDDSDPEFQVPLCILQLMTEEEWCCLYPGLDGCLLLWCLSFQMGFYKTKLGSRRLLETGAWTLCLSQVVRVFSLEVS